MDHRQSEVEIINAAIISLCTWSVSIVERISSVLRAGEVKVPTQLYLPLWDVFSRSKVSVRMSASSVEIVETVIPFPLVTATPPVVQVAVGELIKPSTALDTVQVRL
jgi:hypothetical protein